MSGPDTMGPLAVGEAIAAAALALVGAPFRLHGRDPATGLDCIGLALLAFRAAGLNPQVRDDYRVCVRSGFPVEEWARRAGLIQMTGDMGSCCGDLVVVRPSPVQLHMLVKTGAGPIAGHVHAHAGLGRVVLVPGEPPWPVHSRWRAETPKFQTPSQD